ncbi:hypothetical protein KCP77_04610 [Salmonella enterica subsp. enterica]|nr:hypothetical protein KCP77_04610 [Salmonella enterica subsp. enterica]
MSLCEPIGRISAFDSSAAVQQRSLLPRQPAAARTRAITKTVTVNTSHLKLGHTFRRLPGIAPCFPRRSNHRPPYRYKCCTDQIGSDFRKVSAYYLYPRFTGVVFIKSFYAVGGAAENLQFALFCAAAAARGMGSSAMANGWAQGRLDPV